MKYFAIIAIMAVGILLFGCTGGQEAKAPAQGQPVVPPQEPPPAEAPPVPEPAPAEAPKVQEPEAKANPCEGKTGAQKIDCAYLEARTAKDVALCASLLAEKDDKFKCITQWCASDARDFTQCEKLSGDDRLGCLNKCNPNMNT